MQIATDSTSFGDLLKTQKQAGSYDTDIRTKVPKGPKPDRAPSGKRTMSYHRNLAKAEAAVLSGEIQPSIMQIRKLCSCGQPVATSIRAELLRKGLGKTDSAGKMSATA